MSNRAHLPQVRDGRALDADRIVCAGQCRCQWPCQGDSATLRVDDVGRRPTPAAKRPQSRKVPTRRRRAGISSRLMRLPCIEAAAAAIEASHDHAAKPRLRRCLPTLERAIASWGGPPSVVPGAESVLPLTLEAATRTCRAAQAASWFLAF
jgi:hypothetical protein